MQRMLTRSIKNQVNDIDKHTLEKKNEDELQDSWREAQIGMISEKLEHLMNNLMEFKNVQFLNYFWSFRLLNYEMKNLVYQKLIAQNKMKLDDPRLHKVQQSMDQIQEKLPFIEDRQWQLYDMVFNSETKNDEDLPYIRKMQTHS